MTVNINRGFTLVELIATLIIIALIATVTGPLFFDIGIFRQRGFYEETLSAIRYAQKHAVATGCTVRVRTDATGFALLRPADVATCVSGPYGTLINDPSGNSTVFTRSVPDGVTLDTADFTFTASGVASANQTININGVAIRVISATGYVGR